MKAALKRRKAKHETDAEITRNRHKPCRMLRTAVLPNLKRVISRMEPTENKSKCAESMTDDNDAIMADAHESVNMEETLVLEVDRKLS